MTTEGQMPQASVSLLKTLYDNNYSHGLNYSLPPSHADQETRAAVDALGGGGYLVIENRTESDDVLTLTCRGIDYVETHQLASPESITRHQNVRHGLLETQKRIRAGDSHAESHWEEEVRRNNYHSDLLHFSTVIFVREPHKYCL